MDVVAADKTKVMEEEKDEPSRAMLRSILLSVLHVLDLWASRHDLLVLSLEIGDNKLLMDSRHLSTR
jgi:hypothetical protein